MSTSGSESRNELLGLIDTAIKTHQRRHHAPSGMLYWKHEDQMTEDALQAARAFIQSAGGASGFADWLRSHPFEPRRSGARIYTLDDLMAAWQAARSIPSHELGSAHIDRWEVNIINRPGDYAYLKHRKSQTGQWVTFDDHLRAMQSHVGDSEGHPGIAHDLETFRTALITIRDECFNGHAYDIAERALNDATDSTVKEKP
jgi:hypothetical protein